MFNLWNTACFIKNIELKIEVLSFQCAVKNYFKDFNSHCKGEISIFNSIKYT